MPDRPEPIVAAIAAAGPTPVRPAAQSLGEHIRRTVRLAPPVMLARLGLVVMVTVDTAMTGRVSGSELAAYSISMAPQIIMLTIGAGMLTGTVVMTAEADGANAADRTGRILRFALLIAAVLGILFSAIQSQGEAILLAVGQSAELSAAGGRVLDMWAIGMPALTLYMAASFFLEGLSRPRAGMVVMLGANLLNILLNWLLIYGHAGLPAMGAEGAALATSITRWAMCAAIFAYVWFGIDHKRYGVRHALAGHWHMAGRLMALGAPFAIGIGLESTAFATIATFAGWLGDLPLAAYQIAINYNALVYMLALGLSTATAVRVANAIGREDPKGMRTAGWVGTGLVLVPMIAAALILLVATETVVGFYTTDAAVVPFALAAMLVVPAICITDGVQGVLMGAVRGASDIWVPNAIYGISFWVIGVPLAWWWGVAENGGAAGLLWAVAVALVAAASLLGWRFHALSRGHVRRG
jgi:MATE family multidrug resistance protein